MGDVENMDPRELQQPSEARPRSTLWERCTNCTSLFKNYWSCVESLKLILQKYQTVLSFVILMCTLALAQGIMLSYFRKTIKVWTEHYRLSSTFAGNGVTILFIILVNKLNEWIMMTVYRVSYFRWKKTKTEHFVYLMEIKFLLF